MTNQTKTYFKLSSYFYQQRNYQKRKKYLLFIFSLLKYLLNDIKVFKKSYSKKKVDLIHYLDPFSSFFFFFVLELVLPILIRELSSSPSKHSKYKYKTGFLRVIQRFGLWGYHNNRTGFIKIKFILSKYI